MRPLAFLALTLFIASCSKGEAKEEPRDPSASGSASGAAAGSAAGSGSAASSGTPTSISTSTSATTSETKGTNFVAWLKARLPTGGTVEETPEVRVVHKIVSGDTAQSIADAYLDLTDVYLADDLASQINKLGVAIAPGNRITIPGLLRVPYKEPAEDRLGWPADKVLRGIFLTGVMSGKMWIPTLDRVASHGMNAVVLDGKDYMGPVNYPTKAKIAVETKAADKPFMRDLARTIRFAHARGIRVILRLPCFHDPWAAKKASRLSVMGTWGKPFPLGWLDPTNPEAQEYVLELAAEMADAGADEVQLDYIRFPVQGPLKSAVLPPAKDGQRSRIVRDIVKRVAAVVHPKGVKLSLDIFGVAATGQQEDIEALGQDIAIIGGAADALSPMVYPSHYDSGFMGFKDPANHPEIIGIGTKASVDKLKKGKVEGTVIRSWLQAFSWRTPNYGTKYIADEVAQAEKHGTGWLMWDPGCMYGPAWAALPKTKP